MGKQKIDYAVLQDMDYVFTASKGILGGLIRRFETSWKNFFNMKIANHEGRIIILEKDRLRFTYIMEMVVTKDGQAGDLKLRPLSTYTNGGFWDPIIVSIKRHPLYDNADIRHKGMTKMLELKESGKIRYDWSGCGKHAWFLKWLPNSKNRFYCSEFSEMIDQFVFGSSIVLNKLGNFQATPYDHQISVYINEVEGWKV